MFKHLRDYLFLFLLFCLIGTGLEWVYGTFWNVMGVTLWIYPGSPLAYTSLAVIPQWGFGGLVGISVYRAVMDRSARRLLGAIIPLALAALWVLLYSQVFYHS